MYEIFEHKTSGHLSMPVISVLPSWGLIARNNVIKCNKGHYLELCPSTAYCDGVRTHTHTHPHGHIYTKLYLHSCLVNAENKLLTFRWGVYIM
ncbi:hypothetical protein QTP88_008566 [Uroleucon formosanum]